MKLSMTHSVTGPPVALTTKDEPECRTKFVTTRLAGPITVSVLLLLMLRFEYVRLLGRIVVSELTLSEP